MSGFIHMDWLAFQPMKFLCYQIWVMVSMAGIVVAPAWAVGERVVDQARGIERLHSLLVLHDGVPVIEHVQAGPGLSRPANIKSLSKTVLSVIAGMAIDKGVVSSVDQPLMELLGELAPDGLDSRVRDISFGDALAMQAGLASTSGRNYGRWVQSDNWVAHALTRPMIAQPGGRMIYSTGATHLVSAALTEASGESTLVLARRWLGEPLNIRIPPWLTDPQGIYFGGNDMHLSPRALARVGELYRLGGELEGRRVLSEQWITASWTANGRSPWTGDDYGYGWFITELADQRAYYGRGYGGQALFVIPESRMTVVITSNPNPPSSGSHFRQLRNLVAFTIQELESQAQSVGESQLRGLR